MRGLNSLHCVLCECDGTVLYVRGMCFLRLCRASASICTEYDVRHPVHGGRWNILIGLRWELGVPPDCFCRHIYDGRCAAAPFFCACVRFCLRCAVIRRRDIHTQ
jgi:hypothetical protein